MDKYKRNIRLYGVIKIFTKRVFLPLTTIYLVEVGGFSIVQIGLLATLSAVVSIIAEIPTGYFADRISRKSSAMIGGAICTSSALTFAFWPQFPGPLLAVCLESIGYAFLSGAAEALIHDTLVHMKQSDNYAKVAGRAQSFGLVGNTILVALVPLSYSINKSLPFIIGALSYMGLVFTASLLREPPRKNLVRLHDNPVKDLILNIRVFVFRSTIIMFMAIGILYGLNGSVQDFTNLIFKDLGINPSYLGFAFAASSIVGIIGGYYIHLLRNISLRTYALLDTFVFCAYTLAIGISHNLTVSIIAFIICMGWWRLRNILYTHHLLKIYKKSSYKATLISTVAFFYRINETWLPFVYVAAIGSVGYYVGYIWIGAISAVILVPLVILGATIMARHFQKYSVN